MVLEQRPVFECGSTSVPVSLLGDDLTFGYVIVLDAKDINLEVTPFAAGGFGSIYRGKLHGAAVVAKELKADKVQDGFSEFQHEVSLMAGLQHANIVRLFGIMLNPMRMIIEV